MLKKWRTIKCILDTLVCFVMWMYIGHVGEQLCKFVVDMLGNNYVNLWYFGHVGSLLCKFELFWTCWFVM